MEFGYQTMKEHIRQSEIDKVPQTMPQISPGGEVKFFHAGYPLGCLIPGEQAGEQADDFFIKNGFVAYSQEVRAMGDDCCVAAYLHKVLRDLIGLSCGKCVLCREGIWQLALIFESITRGKANMDRLDFAQELAHAMVVGSDCDFGRGCGRLIEQALIDFKEEISDHIRRKRCAALTCKAFYTLHILPEKCNGCSECLEECPEEAIEGKPGFIHMIDNDLCERCGKCADICPQNAVVRAGTVKPRTPVRLTRVGMFRSQRRC